MNKELAKDLYEDWLSSEPTSRYAQVLLIFSLIVSFVNMIASTAEDNGGFQDIMNQRTAFAHRIDGMLKPGNKVTILEGMFRIDPDIDRRFWPQRVDSFFRYRNNLLPKRDLQEVTNPIYLEDSGTKALVFYPRDRSMPDVVIIDGNSDRGISTSDGYKIGVLDRIDTLKKEVPVCTTNMIFPETFCMTKASIASSLSPK